MRARQDAYPRGWLVAIGGSEKKDKDAPILKEFVRLSGGAKARIAVMTVATNRVKELGGEYVGIFKRLGADDVYVVDISSREQARSQEVVEQINRATAIFFTGGDQLQVTSLIGGSEVDRALHKRYQEGAVIAGTSAGAAMMSNTMIVTGPPQESPRLGSVKLGPGMEFFLGGVIDTHFSQRGRHGRLLTIVAQYPHDLGIGLDEDTAIILKDGRFEVLGSGAVTVMDAGTLNYTNVPDAKEGDGLALYNIKLHVLTSGHRFDMNNRIPIYDGKAGQAAADNPGDAPARRSKKSRSRRGKR